MKKIIQSIALTGSLLVTPMIVSAAEYELVFQSAYTKKEFLFKEFQDWATQLEKSTDGQLKIEVLPDGGIVAYNQTLDAMRMGILDGHISIVSLFADKEPAFLLLCNPLGAWDSGKQAANFMKAEGNKLIEKGLQKYNVKLLGTFNTDIEAFASTKATKGVDDLKGMDIRAVDSISSDIYRSLGANPVRVSASLVADGIKQGILQAADISTLADNQSTGLNKIANNPVYPGFRLLTIDFSMSQKKWETLPPELQQKLTDSIEQFGNRILAESTEADQKTLEELKGSNIKVHSWSQKEREKFRKKAKTVWKTIAIQSPLAEETYDKLVDYLNK